MLYNLRVVLQRAYLVLGTLVFFLIPLWAEKLPQTKKETNSEAIQRAETKNLYRTVPNIRITTLDKKVIGLLNLWDERPLLITLFYRRCTGACSPFLRSLKAAVEKNGGVGEDYNVLALSFDEKDTLDDVREMADAVGVSSTKGWILGKATNADIARLDEAIGFWFKEDARKNQFDHPSLVAGVKKGKVQRVLLGVVVDPLRLKEVIFTLKGIFVPFYAQPNEDTIFRCLDYNAQTGEVMWSWGMFILIIPGVLALLIAVVIFRHR